MSREKRTPLNPWESILPAAEKHFSRLGDSLLDSPVFNELSPYARLLYMYMVRAAAGKRDFTFQHSFYKRYGITDATFGRLRDELVNAGFITVLKNNRTVRKANIYQFSTTWKEKIKMGKVIHHGFLALSP